MTSKFGLVVLGTLLVFHAGPASALTVRSGDIMDGEVKNLDIGANAVTTEKILDLTVGTVDLADGAVTDAKISGTISGAKIGGTVGNADMVDGMHAAEFALAAHAHDALYQKKYGKIAVVAVSGGDYIDPVSAMADLGSWCGTPSPDHPCLLKIMPGVFDLGASLNLQDHVDVEGAGEGVTRINGGINVYLPYGSGSSELRSLTVESSDTALFHNGNFAIRISDVTLTPAAT